MLAFGPGRQHDAALLLHNFFDYGGSGGGSGGLNRGHSRKWVAESKVILIMERRDKGRYRYVYLYHDSIAACSLLLLLT